MSLSNDIININQNAGTLIKKKQLPQIFYDTTEIDKTLAAHYKQFWHDIYYNDSYVYFKHAFAFYQNTENGKFHYFFSKIINKKLFEGSCSYIDVHKREDWFNDTNPDKKQITNIDDLCRLTVQTINLMDELFTVSPMIPIDTTLYRFEFRENKDVPLFKKGHLYRSLGFMSTSIIPYVYGTKHFLISGPYSKYTKIMYRLRIPKGSMGYYINAPFGPYHDNNINAMIGFFEHEIVLPRENLYEIVKVKKTDNIIFVDMRLYAQIKQLKPVKESTDYSIKDDVGTIIQKNDINVDNYNIVNVSNKNIGIYPVESLDQNPEIVAYINFMKRFKDDILDDGLVSSYYQALNLCQYSLKELKELDQNTVYDPKKYPDKEMFENLLKIWIGLDTKKEIPPKKMFMTLELDQSSSWKNTLYKKVIDKIDKKQKIKFMYPFAVETKFDDSLYFNGVHILKKSYQSSNKNIFDDLYEIDNTYPRFCAIELTCSNKKIGWIKLSFNTGIVVDMDHHHLLEYSFFLILQ